MKLVYGEYVSVRLYGVPRCLALVTLRASQGGFGDLPALRPEQHRRRQEENSSRDEKYAIFKPHATTGTPSESSQTDGQTNRAHTQPMPRADLFRNRNGRLRDLARAISSQGAAMCLLLTSSMVDGMGPKVGSVSAPAGAPYCAFQASKPSADKLDLADFSVEYAPQRRAVARSGGGACRCAWWKV